MSESESTAYFACGSSSPTCKCNCDPERDPKTFDHVCEHDWSGWREFDNGGEAVCSRCNMGFEHHMLMCGF